MSVRSHFIQAIVVMVLTCAPLMPAQASSLVSLDVGETIENVASQKILEAKIQVDTIFERPDSVMRGSCFDQFLKKSKDIGNIFGDIGVMDSVGDAMKAFEDPWGFLDDAINDAINGALDGVFKGFSGNSINSLIGNTVNLYYRDNFSVYKTKLPPMSFSTTGDFADCDAAAKAWTDSRFKAPTLDLNMSTKKLMDMIKAGADPRYLEVGKIDGVDTSTDPTANLPEEALTIVFDKIDLAAANKVTDPGVCGGAAIPTGATEFFEDGSEHFAYFCSNLGCSFDKKGNASKTLIREGTDRDKPPAMTCKPN